MTKEQLYAQISAYFGKFYEDGKNLSLNQWMVKGLHSQIVQTIDQFLVEQETGKETVK